VSGGARLRLAKLEETDRLAAFCADVFEMPADYFRRRWRHDPGLASYGVLLEVGGEILGYAHVFDRRLNAGAASLRCAGLANVAVAAAVRGRGYARALIERCIDEAASRGFQASLLHTHIPRLYERIGYRAIKTHDVALEGAKPGWFEARELSAEDRQLYCRDHGSRPGTLVRDQRYWEAREQWLRPEGWRIFKHGDAGGYCMTWQQTDEPRIDEAAGDCLALLRQGGPKPANWRWRVPGRLAAKIAPAPPSQSVPMVRPLIEDIDLTALASPDAVLWMTDTF
jgi:predicted N-acetyltransferase YhbS